MKEIKDFLPKEVVRKPGSISEWADLVGYFTDRLRDKKGRKYSAAFISMKLSKFKKDYSKIYYIQKECNKSGNFGKCFWGLIKRL